MKQLLQGRFLSPDDEQYIFYVYHRCTHGSKSVKEYTTEFLRLIERNQLSESENQQASRYLSGLKQTIRDKIGVQMVFNVQEARNLAMKAELLILEQTHGTNYKRYGGVDNKAPSDKGKTPLAMWEIVQTINVGVGKGKSVAVEGGMGNTFVPTKNSNPYAKPFGVKCYRCGEVGHRSNECPKRKATNVVEKANDVVENEVCGPDGDDDYEEYEQEEYTCVVRKLILSPK